MNNLYILPVFDFEIVFNYLDPIIDYKNLLLVNKYYYHLVTCDETYREIKEFYKRKNELDLDKPSESIDDHTKEFMKCCQYGYKRMAQYLYKHYEINIHVQQSLARFRYAQRPRPQFHLMLWDDSVK